MNTNSNQTGSEIVPQVEVRINETVDKFVQDGKDCTATGLCHVLDQALDCASEKLNSMAQGTEEAPELQNNAIEEQQSSTIPKFHPAVIASPPTETEGSWKVRSQGLQKAASIYGFAPPPPGPDLLALLGNKLVTKTGMKDTESVLGDSYVGLYFSAHWCRPCQNFTPKLVKFYEDLRAQGKHKFEIVLISSDEDESASQEYYQSMPWAALPFNVPNKDLRFTFDVKGIPTLIILDKTGKVMTKLGTEMVTEDPTGGNFPWPGSCSGVSREPEQSQLSQQSSHRYCCFDWDDFAFFEIDDGGSVDFDEMAADFFPEDSLRCCTIFRVFFPCVFPFCCVCIPIPRLCLPCIFALDIGLSCLPCPFFGCCILYTMRYFGWGCYCYCCNAPWVLLR